MLVALNASRPELGRARTQVLLEAVFTSLRLAGAFLLYSGNLLWTWRGPPSEGSALRLLEDPIVQSDYLSMSGVMA